MRRFLLILGLLGLCHAGRCGDLSLAQLKDRLPKGVIPLGSIGVTRSIRCYLDANLLPSPEGASPAGQQRGTVTVWVHAFDTGEQGGLVESGVGYLIEARGSITLKPDVDYAVKGYETGEFVRKATTSPDAAADPALLYHPFFVVLEADELGKVPGS